MNLSFREGQKVSIKCSNGEEFEGIFKSVSKSFGRMTFKNVRKISSGKTMKEVHFYDDELQEVKVCEDVSVLSEEGSSDVNNSEAAPVADDQAEVLTNVEPLVTENFENIIENYTYINQINETFFNSIDLLDVNEQISVFVCDVSKGRNGRASLISLATKFQIFIYDLELLGDVAFMKGLNSILESKSIEKVFLDSRLASDCLFHKHATKLVCVRDIEAEDIGLRKLKKEPLRKYVKDLNYFISRYLGLSDKVPDCDLSKNKLVERPLGVDILNSVAVRTAYLLAVHNKIIKDYLSVHLMPLNDLYVSLVRDSDDVMFCKYQSCHTKTPMKEIKNFYQKQEVKPEAS